MKFKDENNEIPCELLAWHLLPAIRSELAKSIRKERFTQKEIAKKTWNNTCCRLTVHF